MGEARDVEVETRTEESEAGKEEERWKRRPPGGRSLASVTRLQLPWRIGWRAGLICCELVIYKKGTRGGGSRRERKGEGPLLVPLPTTRSGADSHLSGRSQR